MWGAGTRIEQSPICLSVYRNQERLFSQPRSSEHWSSHISVNCYCNFAAGRSLPKLFRDPFPSLPCCPHGSFSLESLLVVRELGVQVTTKYVDGREKSTVRFCDPHLLLRGSFFVFEELDFSVVYLATDAVVRGLGFA